MCIGFDGFIYIRGKSPHRWFLSKAPNDQVTKHFQVAQCFICRQDETVHILGSFKDGVLYVSNRSLLTEENWEKGWGEEMDYYLTSHTNLVWSLSTTAIKM